MRRKQILIIIAIVATAFLLSGCGVNRSGVDVSTTAPEGLWQTLIVWPLAKALIWIDELLQSWNVPYHWGFAIILFTVLVKVLTFPLTISQIRGMQAQKELQPKIQELQKKYGKDREKLSQEQMKLYQEAGVNPLSGCLPLVIQMPILFGLYSALVVIGPSLENANFFWIPDLGFPQYTQGMSWITEAFNAGDYGTLVAYLILPVLLMVSQFIMQKWMTPATAPVDSDNPTAGMMKQMSLMMTLMFGFFTLQVPAGLTLYWVTSNLLQMLQQWVVTDTRFGLAKPSTPATVTAGSAALPDRQKPTGNGIAPASTPAATSQAAKEEQAKEVRRRRAKRR
ncbi:MAG: membrane protein insertase YidC [Caldilineaceae bacterium]|nr:membrane protein insertase YidC [Caldilineaceae bacterium]